MIRWVMDVEKIIDIDERHKGLPLLLALEEMRCIHHRVEYGVQKSFHLIQPNALGF